MLFKQSDLSYDPFQEASDILNESVYLDESEAVVSAKAIPVVENNTIGAFVVRFNDVSTFAEDHGVSYEDAMNVIAESNNIDVNDLAVAVKETTIMANPSIVNELCNVVVTPIPETDSMYQFTEACVDAFIESGDVSYMDLLVEETTNNEPRAGEPGGATKYTYDGNAFKIDKDGNRTNYRTLGGRIQDAAANAKATRDNAKLDMQNEKSTIKKLLKAVKYYGYTTPKERIAAALSALTKKYNKIIANIPEDPSQRKWYQSILKTIDNIIRKLTGFLNKKNGQKDKDNSTNAHSERTNAHSERTNAHSERETQERSVVTHNSSTSNNTGGSSNSSHSSAGSYTSNPRLYAPRYTLPSGNSTPRLGGPSDNPKLSGPKPTPRLGGPSGAVLRLPAPSGKSDSASHEKPKVAKRGVTPKLAPDSVYEQINRYQNRFKKPHSFTTKKVKNYLDYKTSKPYYQFT